MEKVMNKKLWGGVFAKDTNEQVVDYTASIHFDQALFYEDILGSLAHAAMLKKCNLITAEEHQKIKQGLIEIEKNISKKKINFSIADEDIHMNIERLLVDLIGYTGKKLHTARSRNDQVSLDMHLYLRKQTLMIVDCLTQLNTSLCDLAKNNHDTLLPGYTHLQRAQPIFLSQYFLGFVSMFSRDIKRLKDNWSRLNISPLGACALAGTSLIIDKQYTSDLLGFDGTYENTIDAVSDRDFVIEFLSTCSLIMLHISRLSEELILWCSQEFQFITFADEFCTGSSIMPQKKNPDVVELGRGKTGRVYGALMSVLTMMKALPLSYNKDLQEDKEAVFDTVKTVKQTLIIYNSVLSNLKINKDNMEKALQNGFLNATLLAEYLVNKNIAFREAHEIVGNIVQYAKQKNRPLEDLPLFQLQQFHSNIDETIYEILNLTAMKKQHHFSIYEAYEKTLLGDKAWYEDKNKILNKVTLKLFALD